LETALALFQPKLTIFYLPILGTIAGIAEKNALIFGIFEIFS